MFSPAQAVAELDAALGQAGQTVTFKRATVVLEMPAFVRGFRPAELVGVLKQGDRNIVVSPTSLGALGLLRAQDKVLIGGASATVQSVEAVYMADVLVRLNLIVRGD